MTQSRLRVVIFTLWMSGLLLSLLAAALAPVVRSDGSVGSEQISLTAIAGVFVPALSCLAGFWFPEKERAKAKEAPLSRDRATIALVLTSGYLLIVLSALLWPLFGVDYVTTGVLEPVKGTSLEERLADAIKLAALLSPLPLAPIHLLTASTA